MNVNPRIQTIGTAMSIPTFPDEMNPLANDGEYPSTFITYLYTDERPTLRGSGRDIAEAATIRLNLFTKGDPITLKETLKQKLREDGFTILNASQYFEKDVGMVNVMITCWDWDVINYTEEDSEEDEPSEEEEITEENDE